MRDFFSLQVFFFLATLMIINVSCIEFSYEIKHKEEICFCDSILKDKLVVVELTTVQPGIVLSVRSGRSKNDVIFNASNETQIKHSFTTQRTAEYKFCLKNPINPEPITTFFRMLVGLEAKDFSELASKNKLKPMENEMRKLEGKYGDIQKQHEVLIKYDEMKLENVNLVSGRIFYSSVITIICIVVLTAVQSYYIKDFFKAKKMI